MRHTHDEARWINGRVYCLCGEELGGYADGHEDDTIYD